MATIEKELFKDSPDHNAEDRKRLEDAKKTMGKRQLNSLGNFENALKGIRNGTLDKNNKAMQAMRRTDAWKDAQPLPKGKMQHLISDFFGTEIEKLVQAQVFTETLEEEEIEHGEMVSFDRMVELEGGSQNIENVRAAETRCKKYVKKGWPYYRKDTWSERSRYMFVHEHTKSTKRNSWAKQTSGNVRGRSRSASAKKKTRKKSQQEPGTEKTS